MTSLIVGCSIISASLQELTESANERLNVSTVMVFCYLRIYCKIVGVMLSTALAKNHAKPANGDTSSVKKINKFQFS